MGGHALLSPAMVKPETDVMKKQKQKTQNKNKTKQTNKQKLKILQKLTNSVKSW